MSFDRLKGTGLAVRNPGFESDAAWDVRDSGGAMLAAIDHYDPDTLKNVFGVVSAAYGSYEFPHRAPPSGTKDEKTPVTLRLD